MKKLFQIILSYKTIDVVDANSRKKQKATYFMCFGISLFVIYKSYHDHINKN